MLDDEVVIRLLDHGTVRSTDGQALGRVGQLFRSDIDGEATWVSIDHGQAADGLQTLVPMAGSTVDGNDLQVAYPADAIAGAPQVAVGAAVSGEDERRVREFYAEDVTPQATAVDHERYAALDEDSMDDDSLADVAVHRRAAVEDRAPGDDRPSDDEDLPIDGPGPADGLEPARGATDGAPVTDVLSVVRSEEKLAVDTQWVPVRRARLEKFQVTETRTIEVEWTREDVRVVYEPLDHRSVESSAGAAQSPPTEPRPWVLMEERIVVTKEWVPAQTVRLVVDRVAGEQIVSEPVRKEQVELQAVDPVEPATSD